MFAPIKTGGSGAVQGGITLINTTTSDLTYSVVVPENVTAISALAIGGGGGGGGKNATDTVNAGAGGGGALAYINNQQVTPGQTLTVVVGRGGAGNTATDSGSAGGNSSIKDVSVNLLIADSGKGGAGGATSGTPAGGAGGTNSKGDVENIGGAGGNGSGSVSAGGGGAAGYSGTGGAGGYSGNPSQAGAGGGGGGGGYDSSTGAGDDRGGNGGGTLFYGTGGNGAAGTNDGATFELKLGGFGSALGSKAKIGNAAIWGGGGAGGGESNGTQSDGKDGGGGVVRILWGNSPLFPSTNVKNDLIYLAATSNSNASTINVPNGVTTGDLLVLLQYSKGTATTPTANAGTGFTTINNTANTGSFVRVQASVRQVLDPLLSGTSITGMNGDSVNQKIMLVFRGARGYSYSTFADYNGEAYTSSAPTTQVKNLSSHDSYLEGIPLVVSLFVSTANITPSTDLTFSGGSFIKGYDQTIYAGYKVYNQSTTSFSDSISMADVGENSMMSFITLGY